MSFNFSALTYQDDNLVGNASLYMFYCLLKNDKQLKSFFNNNELQIYGYKQDGSICFDDIIDFAFKYKDIITKYQSQIKTDFCKTNKVFLKLDTIIKYLFKYNIDIQEGIFYLLNFFIETDQNKQNKIQNNRAYYANKLYNKFIITTSKIPFDQDTINLVSNIDFIKSLCDTFDKIYTLEIFHTYYHYVEIESYVITCISQCIYKLCDIPQSDFSKRNKFINFISLQNCNGWNDLLNYYSKYFIK